MQTPLSRSHGPRHVAGHILLQSRPYCVDLHPKNKIKIGQ